MSLALTQIFGLFEQIADMLTSGDFQRKFPVTLFRKRNFRKTCRRISDGFKKPEKEFTSLCL